jgi:hypothetical protein
MIGNGRETADDGIVAREASLSKIVFGKLVRVHDRATQIMTEPMFRDWFPRYELRSTIHRQGIEKLLV